MVLLVALLVFGPGKIQEVSRTVGKVTRDLRKAGSDFTSAITREADTVMEPLRQTAEALTSDSAARGRVTEPPNDSVGVKE